MKIVIEIDDEIYDYITKEYTCMRVKDSHAVAVAIANGTPLPKGHGRLKDIDKIISNGTSKGFCDWYDEMKYADTIIEADKEG